MLPNVSDFFESRPIRYLLEMFSIFIIVLFMNLIWCLLSVISYLPYEMRFAIDKYATPLLNTLRPC